MTMHVKGEGLKFPDGSEQTTAAIGGTGDDTGGSGVYTKSETDVLLNAKANVGVSYTKAETDIQINNKANVGVSYTKAETEVRLATKADVANSYTKAQIDALINASIPRGVISIWSGSTGTVPSGWTLCNGVPVSGVTPPNLMDRFIVGAGSSYGVNATGGSANAVVVSHYHTGTTSADGNHAHAGVPLQAKDSDRGTGSSSVSVDNIGLTDLAGYHAHNFVTSTAGSSGTNANLPPYYSLAYIMKL